MSVPSLNTGASSPPPGAKTNRPRAGNTESCPPSGAEADCRHPGGLELTRRGLALCAFPPGARIADIGCGAGATVRELRTLGYCCVGFDERMHRGDFPGVRARAEALPLARESLHGIVCECVLSLLPEPERVLRDFWLACRHGGRLLLSDLYAQDTAAATSGLFTLQRMEKALHGAGWRVTHCEERPRALKEFAARLLWYSQDDALPRERDFGAARSACGYALWIAQKEDR